MKMEDSHILNSTHWTLTPATSAPEIGLKELNFHLPKALIPMPGCYCCLVLSVRSRRLVASPVSQFIMLPSYPFFLKSLSPPHSICWLFHSSGNTCVPSFLSASCSQVLIVAHADMLHRHKRMLQPLSFWNSILSGPSTILQTLLRLLQGLPTPSLFHWNPADFYFNQMEAFPSFHPYIPSVGP